MVSSKKRVGVDIEKTSPVVEKIRDNSFHQRNPPVAFEGIEKSGHRLRQLTLLWSAKESIFKWYSLGGVDFREHILWREPYFIRSEDFAELSFEFRKTEPIPLSVFYKIFDDLVLTFVYT